MMRCFAAPQRAFLTRLTLARFCASSSATPPPPPPPPHNTPAGGKPADGAGSSEDSSSQVGEHNSRVTDNALLKKSNGFLEPSDDVVLEYARKALTREGRDEIPESVVWKWETTGPPILAQGKQNFYDYTDDIPKHVKPFWHHEYYQQREYFRLQREKRPLKERLRIAFSIFIVLGAAAITVVVARIWITQPKEIHELREVLLQNTYGRVLELAAGHGQNIGSYPYAVHEIVMCDSNAQQLETLRYRIPKTAYPKYEIRRVRSESLDCFKDEEFDCVVDMFGLCHLRDPVMALRQMQRVVKPSGMILLLEHGLTPYPWVNWFLNFFEKRHLLNTHGCKWNTPMKEYFKEARLEIKELRNMHYGTTYYVIAYPEVVAKVAAMEAAAAEVPSMSSSSADPSAAGNAQQDSGKKKKKWWIF